MSVRVEVAPVVNRLTEVGKSPLEPNPNPTPDTGLSTNRLITPELPPAPFRHLSLDGLRSEVNKIFSDLLEKGKCDKFPNGLKLENWNSLGRAFEYIVERDPSFTATLDPNTQAVIKKAVEIHSEIDKISNNSGDKTLGYFARELKEFHHATARYSRARVESQDKTIYEVCQEAYKIRRDELIEKVFDIKIINDQSIVKLRTLAGFLRQHPEVCQDDVKMLTNNTSMNIPQEAYSRLLRCYELVDCVSSRACEHREIIDNYVQEFSKLGGETKCLELNYAISNLISLGQNNRVAITRFFENLLQLGENVGPKNSRGGPAFGGVVDYLIKAGWSVNESRAGGGTDIDGFTKGYLYQADVALKLIKEGAIFIGIDLNTFDSKELRSKNANSKVGTKRDADIVVMFPKPLAEKLGVESGLSFIEIKLSAHALAKRIEGDKGDSQVAALVQISSQHGANPVIIVGDDRASIKQDHLETIRSNMKHLASRAQQSPAILDKNLNVVVSGVAQRIIEPRPANSRLPADFFKQVASINRPKARASS